MRGLRGLYDDPLPLPPLATSYYLLDSGAPVPVTVSMKNTTRAR